MSEQLSITTVKPLEYPSNPVKLWSPAVIGLITFILGYPGGLTMAVINWKRMGFIKKAISHLVVGAAGTAACVVLLTRMAGEEARLFGLLVNIAMITYLHNQTNQDIAAFKACNHEVKNAHWLGGVFISFVVWGLFLALAIAVEAFMLLFNVPIPE